MKTHNIILIILIAFVLTFFGVAGWLLNDITTKESSWRTKTITGQIKELKLITSFPDEGCLVSFTDGNFTFIDVNYYWAYSHLLATHSYNLVTITYEINGNGNVRATQINESKGTQWGYV